jgi:hypothetical protein
MRPKPTIKANSGTLTNGLDRSSVMLVFILNDISAYYNIHTIVYKVK